LAALCRLIPTPFHFRWSLRNYVSVGKREGINLELPARTAQVEQKQSLATALRMSGWKLANVCGVRHQRWDEHAGDGRPVGFLLCALLWGLNTSLSLELPQPAR